MGVALRKDKNTQLLDSIEKINLIKKTHLKMKKSLK